MSERKAYHIHIVGDSLQAGRLLGQIALQVPGLADMQRVKSTVFSIEEEQKVYKLFAEFCPGVNEEIAGFAEVLRIPTGQVLYYLSTYLKPGCSQMAVLPKKTANGHTLMARNYDFSDQMEEMTLYTTKVVGKYAHIGSSLMMFGRGDGMNECGLAVSQTSAGIPVGNMEFARKPAVTGLQFWAVIRSILENCSNVDDAVYLATQIPIAYNINLLVADKNGSAVLFESFDGNKCIKKIDENSPDQFICSTNHIHLPELKQYESQSMKNSLIRYELINRTLDESEKIVKEDLRNLLSNKYPRGLCCHFYDELFGTLRSMIYDLNEGIVEICFGSPALNKWNTFRIDDILGPMEYSVHIEREKAPPNFYEMI